VQDVEAAAEGPVICWCEGGVGISEQHKDVPNTKLGWEGDRVVEESEVPAGAIGRGLNTKLVLGESA